jgi:rRNA maturation RNase YbeY
MLVTIENPDFPDHIDEGSLVSVVRQLAAMAQADGGALRPEPTRLWRELTLYLLDDEGIAAVNRAVHGIDALTDVISQRYDPVPGELPGLYGEIFVNVQCACREALSRAEWSSDRELALYIAHGCDHLNDCEDATEEGCRAMRRRELAWLDQLALTPMLVKPII